MAHIPGHDRSQILLLPEAVDDYVGPDNPVRFLEAFVDGLDLQAAGFARVEPKATARPGYAPADLLKLYIYGYLNRVRSSRRLEAEAGRNIEVIWLLRHLQPDFKTIADFRRDNRRAFRPVFRHFAMLANARRLGWPEASSDEVGQVGDSGLVWDGEPGAQVVPERHSKLLAGFHQTQERVPAVASGVAAGSAAHPAPGHLDADVVLRAVGVQRDLRAVEHPQEFRLVGVQPRE